MLLIGHVNFGLWFLRRSVLPDVADHADNPHRLEGVVSGEDRPAEWVLTGKCVPRQGFVDDNREGRIERIAVVEVTAASDRDTERSENPRRYYIHHCRS